MNEWENVDHARPCARCGHGALSHNMNGMKECYAPTAPPAAIPCCQCRGYLPATIKITQTSTLRSAPSTRPIEWAILGVLLWILADLITLSPHHAADANGSHLVLTLIGSACMTWGFLRTLAE